MRRGWECELGFQLVLCPVAATHHITTTIHGACQALLLLLSTAANALATALQIDGALRADIWLLSAPTRLRPSEGLTATDTSISSPRDGRLVGYLASHTSAGTMRCSDSRLVDDRTRYSPSVPIYGCSAHRSLSTVKGSHDDRYIDLEPA